MTRAAKPWLVLGTAQLGMDYGAANRSGKPGEAEAQAIIAAALEAGIRDFDTARSYGESEARLGALLAARKDVRIVTKLSPLDGLAESAARDEVTSAVRASVEASRKALLRPRIDTLLLHRARHLKAWDGAAWDALRALRDEGVVGALGVSVQSPDELLHALGQRDVTHIQMPFNLFDWRFRKPSLRARMAERSDVTVHVRSTLLQGLLAADDASLWPDMPGFDTPHVLRGLAALVEVLGRADLADLCFAYVRAQSFVHGVVVGAETAAQVKQNAAHFKRPALKPDEVEFVERFLPTLPESLLDPARWRKKAA